MKLSPALLSLVGIASLTTLAGCHTGSGGTVGHGTGGHGTGGVAGRSGGGETGAGGVGSGGGVGGVGSGGLAGSDSGAGGVALGGAGGCGRCDAGAGGSNGADARGGADGGFGGARADSGDTLGLDGGGTDGARGADAGGAGEVGQDGPGAGGLVCGDEIDNGALVSSECSVTVADPAAQCTGAGTCPVSAAYTLHCSDSGYMLRVVPLATNGSSVMFVTNVGAFVTHLFSLAPGAARVDDVPALTSMLNALAVDPAGGNRTIFAGEMPGAWRVRETPSGWRRESAVEADPSKLAMVSDARVLDANRAFLAYHLVTESWVPRLAVRDGGCWRTSVLPGQAGTELSLDLDAMNRPWVAWNYSGTTVQMAGPDGTLYTPWNVSTSLGVMGNLDQAIVLGGGVTAASTAYPSLVIQRTDGVHVLVGDAALPRWTDLPIAGSASPDTTTACQYSVAVPSGGCDAIASCTSVTKGAVRGFGAARTASGRAYVAWVATDGETTYSYQGPDYVCSSGLRQCCHSVTTSSSGVSSVVLTRADTGAEALRLALETGRPLPSTEVALAARGDTLLVVASHDNGSGIEMRYQEVDTTRLP